VLILPSSGKSAEMASDALSSLLELAQLRASAPFHRYCSLSEVGSINVS